MNEPRVAVESWSPGEFIADELEARGWTTADLAKRMPGDSKTNLLTVDLLITVKDENIRIGEQTAADLGVAFGVSPEFFLNLEKAWLDGRKRQEMRVGDRVRARLSDYACGYAAGVIEDITDTYVRVRMDRSRRVVSFRPENLISGEYASDGGRGAESLQRQAINTPKRKE